MKNREKKNNIIVLSIFFLALLCNPYIFLSNISSLDKMQNNAIIDGESESESNTESLNLNNPEAAYLNGIITPKPITNGTWYNPSTPMETGDKFYYVLEDVSFNSANYLIKGWEWNPASINIRVYVKFNEIPTTLDYDYVTDTGNQLEKIEIEVPEDDEYGDMNIMIRCMSGSGYISVYGHYISDSSGCWRSADYLSTPRYGDPAIEKSSSLNPNTDINDFYKVFLYSGQEFYIDAEATTGSTLSCYFYDENHALIDSDTSGIWMDITYSITAFTSAYYYIRFRNFGSGVITYESDFTDENFDSNNRYDDSPTELVSSTGLGSMSSTDINDYWYFWADSGEKITIEITLDDPLSSPYYDAFLYSTSYPVNSEHAKSDDIGKSLDITYYCAEYYTSEISPGTKNKVYLRIWNAAEHYNRPDVTSSYTITITRSFHAVNDHMSAAPSYTAWGNSTVPKYGDLNGEIDNNDWFKISTNAGYTIKIGVNASGSIPNPYLDGYLFDNTGILVDLDTSYNITITYTATYTGNYYFRLYEAPAKYSYGSYTGNAEYDWFIYTSSDDGNDNFTDAEEISPPENIYSSVSIVDISDYYKLEVPGGYVIDIGGYDIGLGSDDLELYFYDSTQILLDSDTSSNSWDIIYQNKGCDPETYYILVNNTNEETVVNYRLTVNVLANDTDNSVTTATWNDIDIGTSASGSDTLDPWDIIDYYSFPAISGDKIFINITGDDGLVAKLFEIQNDEEVILTEGTISDGELILEDYPNCFHPETTYYLRICNPEGVLTSASYDWNISRIEYDTDDGYSKYSNDLETGESSILIDTLSLNDTNDWYKILVQSGETLEINLTSNISDPHVGFKVIDLVATIVNNGSSLYYNFSNNIWYPITCWIQVVNEAKTTGQYTLTVTTTLKDDDNNGSPSIAEEFELDTNFTDVLSFSDINDYYAVEIRSGYNFTLNFHSNFNYSIWCILYDELGYILNSIIDDSGRITFINPNLDPINGFFQFYNVGPLMGYNASKSFGTYYWNATLVNNDPDGDFPNATSIGLTHIGSDSLFANLSASPNNLSDINDFYKLSLGKGGMLSLSVEITDCSDPWFGVYLYNENETIVASETGNNSISLLYCAGANDGDYYIRLFDTVKTPGNYTLAVATYTDDDSYYEGATPVTPGDQTPDDMSNTDIIDIYSIQLEPGWRMKVNATLTGSLPSADLVIVDPNNTVIIGDFNKTDYLEVEFTAELSGLYYIKFLNPSGSDVDYSWFVYVYEDENGVFSTATEIGPGTNNDSVQELDKFDYFNVTGTTGEAITVTCSLQSGLYLEVYIYNSTEDLIDSDTTVPGLALTHTPATDGNFFILFSNPNGETGNYTFELSGVSTPPGEEEEEGGSLLDTIMNFLTQYWQYLAGGAVVLILLIIIIKKIKK
ncbi:MAG: hypothetical protein ACTSWY_12275 [Promethearchaeota archaeon]